MIILTLETLITDKNQEASNCELFIISTFTDGKTYALIFL